MSKEKNEGGLEQLGKTADTLIDSTGLGPEVDGVLGVVNDVAEPVVNVAAPIVSGVMGMVGGGEESESGEEKPPSL